MSRLLSIAPFALFSGYKCTWCKCRFDNRAALSEHTHSTLARYEGTDRICTLFQRCEWCGEKLQHSLDHASYERHIDLDGQRCVPRPLTAPQYQSRPTSPTLLILSLDDSTVTANHSRTDLSERSYATSHSDSMASFHTARNRSNRVSRNPDLVAELEAGPEVINDFVQRILIKSSKFLGRKSDEATRALLHSSIQRFLRQNLAIEASKIPSLVSTINELVVQLCDIVSAGPDTTSGKIRLRSAVARDTLEFIIEAGSLGYLTAHLEAAYKKDFKVIPLGPRAAFSIQWIQHLQASGILLDPADELDWSGRGQHVEFEANDIVPLRSEDHLGSTSSTVVDSVRCRRIKLARKKIHYKKRSVKEMRDTAITEVKYLQSVQHAHIVRVVGTYTQKDHLAILIYPVAQWNLDGFMSEVLDETMSLKQHEICRSNWNSRAKARAMRAFFGCLANALSAIHASNVKHMDIKPPNLLVRPFRSGEQLFKIYVSDFGIARGYASAADSETDTPISFTRKYAAPEVILQDTRGFRADIFSLGCVYLEMLATLVTTSDFNACESLTQARNMSPSGSSFQASLRSLHTWYEEIFLGNSGQIEQNFELGEWLLNSVPQMLQQSPADRPSAGDLNYRLRGLCCKLCDSGVEPFEAAEPTNS